MLILRRVTTCITNYKDNWYTVLAVLLLLLLVAGLCCTLLATTYYPTLQMVACSSFFLVNIDRIKYVWKDNNLLSTSEARDNALYKNCACYTDAVPVHCVAIVGAATVKYVACANPALLRMHAMALRLRSSDRHKQWHNDGAAKSTRLATKLEASICRRRFPPSSFQY